MLHRRLIKTGAFEEEIVVKQYSLLKSIILIIAGFVLLVIGGCVIVIVAVKFAQNPGISERIIAQTIALIGTSLPEPATFTIEQERKMQILPLFIQQDKIYLIIFYLQNFRIL